MKILHLDDHSVFAQALALLLKKRWPGYEYLIAVDTVEAQALAAQHQDIELILLDLILPQGSGLHFMRYLQRERRPIPVAVLTAETRAIEIKAAIDLGAIAYIPKSHTSEQLIAALEQIFSGLPYFPEGFEREVERTSNVDKNDRLSVASRYALSDHQLTVLELVAEGLSNADMARQLGVGENAVKYHLKILFQSFDVSNRVQCVAYARSVNLLN